MSATRPDTDERRLTIGEYARLPDDDRYRDELVRGRLVREPRPGNEHGMIQLNLAAALREHVREHGLGVVRVETGYALEPGVATVRGPDVSFIARNRVPAEGLPRGFPRFAPDLAAEVVSPSNRAAGIREKVAAYFAAGVREVWVVYPRARNVAVHRSPESVRVYGADEELDGGEVVPGFGVRVGELFVD